MQHRTDFRNALTSFFAFAQLFAGSLRRRSRLSGTGWPGRASCCTCASIAGALRQRNPDGLPITLEQPRQAGSSPVTQQRQSAMSVWRGGAEKPARLAPVQKHERERACFCVCTMRFPACGSAWRDGRIRKLLPAASLSLLGRMCSGAGMGLSLLLFARRGTAEFDLCLQFRNLFAKRCHLVLYSSGSGTLI
jgi:hypothetical protein